MERPSAFAALDVPTEVSANDRCDLAKGAYNSAMRGKLAYFWLSFFLAVVLAIAVVYAIIAFDDDESARGFLALVAAIGAFLTSGVFATLGKRASGDADKMWRRVTKYCD